ncbi:hypothetical protein SCHPADRAFT_1002719 [Schizopora paradoxa]|uniref:Uncharacterized protein n=1 Tax=Schizopora paradoxa TaxID=27342 RepID=A0A0H2R8A5_9AGAM|nr:hypothetical protein SCHPADRAFT_1002719 [Schizopora paradoxa]
MTSLDIEGMEPMNFSLVCRSWRDVVVSHPSLWGRMHILHSTTERIDPLLPRIYSKWLQLSRTALLTISLYLDFIGSKNNAELGRIIDTTLAQYSRIKDVDIFLGNLPRKQTFHLPFSPTIVSLSLKVTGKYLNASPDRQASLDFSSCFSSSELLSLATIEGIRWIFPKNPNQNLHFPNVNDLRFSTDVTGDMSNVYKILSACPNVEHLDVQTRRCITSPATSSSISPLLPSISDPVLLSRLCRIYICSQNRAATLQLMEWMTCPSLCVLSIDATKHVLDSEDPDEHCMTRELLVAYRDFVGRSHPPLRYLTLDYSSPPLLFEGHGLLLREMLRPLRNLEVLRLREVAVDTGLFEDMTFLQNINEEAQSSSSICPLLSELMIIYMDPNVLSFRILPGAVKAMLESRRKPPHELKDCKLRLPGSQGDVAGILAYRDGIYA